MMTLFPVLSKLFVEFANSEALTKLYCTFNNISAISWQSFLLVEENGVPRKNHRPVASY
jgi:hypothetical protein